MEKNFEKLMENKEFVEKITQMESKEEVKKAFESEGVTITDEQLDLLGKMFNEIAEKLSTLNEDELQAIAGAGPEDKSSGADTGDQGGLEMYLNWFLNHGKDIIKCFALLGEGKAKFDENYAETSQKIKEEKAAKAAAAQKKSGMNIAAPIAGVVIGATAGAAYLYRDKIRKLWYKKR